MKYLTLALIALLLTQSVSLAAPQETISYPTSQLTLIDNVKVASLDPGVVQKIDVSPGDVVSKDDPLVTLDSELFEAEVAADDLAWKIASEQAESDVNLRLSCKSLAVSQKQLLKSENAVKEYARSISETEIDRLRLERDQACLSIEQAEADGSVARLTAELRDKERKATAIRLRRRNILSPIDGMVVAVDTQSGEAVQSGQTVVRIIGLDKLRVKAVYSSKYALRVTAGQKATFELEDQGKTITKEAQVVFVSPEIRASERVFEVWADIDNSDRKLLPGFKKKHVWRFSQHTRVQNK